ncbi:transporter substrate-binding domain-containing protein [Chromobacterium violaceum]|uniref:substrate-binding periplasmic protein n=1 Tax=Chromobacterium violaceum TaxID=536 RepID=UPI001E301EA6|nr:transporter substrate-binding domain-containing protein [Chromobacterium violaceum]MCD0492678.1 transporter substrate-binding domain-containing protein [Chromobacterium violaceum]
MRSLLVWLVWTSAAVAGPAPFHSYTLAVEPWGVADSDRGVGPDFIRFLAARSGVPVQAEARPYLRVIDGMRSGVNAINLGIPTEERERYGIAICEVATLSVSLVYLKREGRTHASADSFSGLAIGELRGSHTLDAFDRMVRHDKVLLGDMEQGARMLAAGRLDATVCVRPGCGNVLDETGLAADALGEWRLDEQPLRIYVAKSSRLAGDADAMRRLRQACESPEGRLEMRRLLTPYH